MALRNQTTRTRTVPRRQEIEEAVIGLIAEARECDPRELRDELEEGGSDMPIDSLDSVEIMLGLEDLFEVRFPDSADTCDAFQSVETLVTFVLHLAGKASSLGGD